MEKEIQIVRENIRKACERSGRKPEEVLLIGVSKTKPFRKPIALAFGISERTRYRKSGINLLSCRRIASY